MFVLVSVVPVATACWVDRMAAAVAVVVVVVVEADSGHWMTRQSCSDPYRYHSCLVAVASDRVELDSSLAT